MITNGLDASVEAVRLLAMSHGLGTSILVGQRTAEAAEAVMRHHLTGLFGLPAEVSG
ncbi:MULTISPECIES: TetR family transcriptional regulator C-terminal domain-containing protein [Streptomyces]|uniref:TetR family transcriptional regulator C-terminal domain-containing protein n=1 Tax=Streptomyces lycopersici TaxID=2974589 RepID=UPI0021CEE7B0|nr:TetR family transcriptional regulator C-terminal domain-containing protein [Streptomyces sp. NEAU-383]